MYIFNYKGEIVFFDKDKYAFEYEMYNELWKIKYNIDLCSDKENTMDNIITFINN
jgi:hypothetical protein